MSISSVEGVEVRRIGCYKYQEVLKNETSQAHCILAWDFHHRYLVAHTGYGWGCLQAFAGVLLTLKVLYFVRCVSWFYANNRRCCYMRCYTT